MQIHTVRTEGLGDSTYILVNQGIGVVVDPQRDIDRFTTLIEDLNVDVRWILETHLHNDYVSGGRDLARHLGAELVVPAGAAPTFRHTPAFHHEDLAVPELTIRPVHTPGHTPEHVSYMAVIEDSIRLVFSGGSLLVGSSGRSDLLGPERADSLARLQYQSIRRLAQLPDQTGLYPTHGAGSFCTASQTASHTSTIGAEKQSNPGLQHKDVDSFVGDHLSGLVPFPAYYRHMGPANVRGLKPVDLAGVPELRENDFAALEHDAIVVDARPKTTFAAGHIPGSLGIELRKDFGVWVGWVTPFNSRLVLVMDSEQDVDEAIRQLARIGYDRIEGVITDLESWDAELETHPVHTLETFMTEISEGKQVLDVRAPNEWEEGQIEGSVKVYAPDLVVATPEAIASEEPILIACETGYRASIAASILCQSGYKPEVLVGAGVLDVVRAAS